jgi:hypothetical protein
MFNVVPPKASVRTAFRLVPSTQASDRHGMEPCAPHQCNVRALNRPRRNHQAPGRDRHVSGGEKTRLHRSPAVVVRDANPIAASWIMSDSIGRVCDEPIKNAGRFGMVQKWRDACHESGVARLRHPGCILFRRPSSFRSLTQTAAIQSTGTGMSEAFVAGEVHPHRLAPIAVNTRHERPPAPDE